MRNLNQTQGDLTLRLLMPLNSLGFCCEIYNLTLRLLMPLNSLGFCCEIYNRNVQNSTDLQTLNESVFIADRRTQIIA